VSGATGVGHDFGGGWSCEVAVIGNPKILMAMSDVVVSVMPNVRNEVAMLLLLLRLNTISECTLRLFRRACVASFVARKMAVRRWVVDSIYALRCAVRSG